METNDGSPGKAHDPSATTRLAEDSYRQPLKRWNIKHVRLIEILRYIKMSKGRTKLKNNRYFQAEMIARGVFDPEKYIEIRNKSGTERVPVLTGTAEALINEALAIALDYQLADRRNGLIYLTHYGNWVVERWFDIKAPE